MIRIIYLIPLLGSQQAEQLVSDRIRIGNLFNTDRQKIILSRSTTDGDSTFDVMSGIADFDDIDDAAKKNLTIRTTAAAPILVPTQAPLDNSTKAASTAYVDAAVTAGATDDLETVLTVGNDAGGLGIVNLAEIVNTVGTYNAGYYINALTGNKFTAYAENTANSDYVYYEASVSAANNPYYYYEVGDGSDSTGVSTLLIGTELYSDKTGYKGAYYSPGASTIIEATGDQYTVYDRRYNDLRYAPISITQYTDEMAQDAVGGMVDSTLVYVDGTPLLTRAALGGDIEASQASNTTSFSAQGLQTIESMISFRV